MLIQKPISIYRVATICGDSQTGKQSKITCVTPTSTLSSLCSPILCVRNLQPEGLCMYAHTRADCARMLCRYKTVMENDSEEDDNWMKVMPYEGL